MSKSEHPHGKGKTSISTTIPNEVLEALDYLATKSGVTRSTYAREAIIASVRAGRTVSAQELMQRRYNTPEVISIRPAENPTNPKPRRSAGA
jgi:metal-responsive CopG/Arc/MetJ family transcriptional regulator